MEVGKLNVEYRGDTGKTVVRRLRTAGKIPAICLRRRRRAHAVVARSAAALEVARSGQEDQHRIDVDGRRRPDGRVERADGHGARVSEGRDPRQRHARRLHPRRPEQAGPCDGAGRSHRQVRGRQARRHHAPGHSYARDRLHAGQDPDQARGRRHGAGHERGAPRQRSQARRRRARVGRRRLDDLRRHRSEGREGSHSGGGRGRRLRRKALRRLRRRLAKKATRRQPAATRRRRLRPRTPRSNFRLLLPKVLGSCS